LLTELAGLRRPVAIRGRLALQPRRRRRVAGRSDGNRRLALAGGLVAVAVEAGGGAGLADVRRGGAGAVGARVGPDAAGGGAARALAGERLARAHRGGAARVEADHRAGALVVGVAGGAHLLGGDAGLG